jgi:hypothetical protein
LPKAAEKAEMPFLWDYGSPAHPNIVFLMPNINILWPWAQRIAIILGSVAGVPLFLVGLQAALTLNSNDTLFTVFLLIAGAFSLLPLSILASF